MKDWQEAIYNVYTEAKQFEAGKYHPRFGKTAQEFRARGFSVPSRDAMIFISNLLEAIGIFSEEEADSVVKNFNAAERRIRFLDLLETYSDEIKSSADQIESEYTKRLDRYSKVEAVNRGTAGRGDKYSANVAARELAQQQKEEIKNLKSMASGGAADALNVLSTGLDDAEQEMFGSLKDSFEDPTTMFEIKLANAGFADKVVKYLKPFAGDSEIEVYGDSVEFSVEPDSQIAKLVAKIGRNRVEDTINDWLDDNTSGGIAIITPPDEPGSAERLVAPKARRVPMNDPEDTDEEPEYGSPLPDIPEIGDEERYSPRSSSRPSFTGDDEDYGNESFSRRRLGYGAEDEEEDWEREGRRHAASFRPDYPDIDEDGNEEESMESALKQKEGKKKEKEENNEDMLKSLKSSYEHPDTFIEIELNNADSADKVVSYLKTFAGNSEIEINGKTVELFAKPDSQIARLVAKIGHKKVEDSIQNWLHSNRVGGDVYVMSPEAVPDKLRDELRPGFGADFLRSPMFKSAIKSSNQRHGRTIGQGPKQGPEENNEDIKMSPQQINQWMYMQRATRMQNNLRQNERWGNY